ncbi:MAG: FkbM family methyltransferase [Desulfobulbaceae bacterium]|nr:FkbM family methyltransferase [Desulfobulbaceae bacterium]
MEKNSVEIRKDLVFDVGMHQGEDTVYYLKRGFRVVGFDANPELIRENREKFAGEIDRNELVIVEGAIIDDPGIEKVKFYVNEDSSVWGTVHADFAARNEKLGTSSKVVEVKAIDFASCLTEYGIPYYMKIDIEGADLCCLRTLDNFQHKPPYISIESNKVNFADLLQEIELLANLGYTDFKAVQQADVPKMKVPVNSSEGRIVDHVFSKEASGLFGSDLPGNWVDKEGIIKEYRRIFIQYRRYGDSTFWQKNPLGRRFLQALARITGNHYPGWYDTHARHESFSRND